MRRVFGSVPWHGKARERGQALVLFAAGLAGFLGLVGLSIDVGQIVQARTDMQKVADAGAFAGSQDLPNASTAKAKANEYVMANGGASCPECVAISTTEEPNDTITVVARRSINFTFLKAIGLTGTTVSARAKLTSRVASAYQFDNQDVFPYAVWGGNGNTGGCPYGVCAGDMKIYRDNGYAAENVEPSPSTNPNWQVNSNKFKGYFHHGGEVVQADANTWQTFSYGGNAMGQEPLEALHEHYVSGRPIILPVISAARDCGGGGQPPCVAPGGANVQGIQFKIVGWVAVKLTVDPLQVSSSHPFEGKVVTHYATPKGRSGGGSPFPAELAPRVIKLIE